MVQSACLSRFERLMEIADRYARHLSGDREKEMPPGVVLLERDGKLHTVVFDGPPDELAATTRDLVVRHHVTSVALIVKFDAPSDAGAADSLYVFGETAEGDTDERRYRVQSRFRRRRLTPLAAADDDRPAMTRAFRSLFVKHAVGSPLRRYS